MSVAYREGEDWTVADGAPDGVAFDVSVPSADGRRQYRIVRQEDWPGITAGYLIHTPRCAAWRSGHRMCRHVQRALEWADEPLRRYALDVIEAWPLASMTPAGREEMAAAMYQAAKQAIDQCQALEEYEARKDRAKVTHLEAVREFA